VAVLGATGSIGTATIDVVTQLNRVDPDFRWHVSAASGHKNTRLLAELASGLDQPPDRIVLSDHRQGDGLAAEETQLRELGCQIEFGADALVSAASDKSVDVVVAAIVGRAGLESTMAAVESGKRVALANKETLVVAGPVVSRACEQSGAELLPVDSEHSAIFQCIQAAASKPKKTDFNGQRGSLPELESRANGGGHTRVSSGTSDMANGSQNHDRLSHHDQQSTGSDRGSLAFWAPCRSD
jgi:1-deoxy-D-xylulose-5-phosphate reductoisomerase